MTYIYVKDSEGFVVKKLASELQPDEILISKEEFEQLSGDTYYAKNMVVAVKELEQDANRQMELY